MNSLIIEVDDDKYLVRYQVLKSVVSRKHTNKEGKVINRLELHPSSMIVYLYKINSWVNLDTLINSTLKVLKSTFKHNLTYLGRGLSKCSDKDKFDRNTGIRMAIYNIEELPTITKHDINYRILNTKL